MSNYNKVIIFIVVLIIFSASVIYLYTSENSINRTMPEISSNIVRGDNSYNEAVDLLNDRDFNGDRNSAMSASDCFNNSFSQLLSIRNNYTSDTNDVYKKYIDAALNEIELKRNATNYLLTAIDYLENNQNSTGSYYASQANDFMYEAIEFQNVRISIVKDNPSLFK